MAHTVGPRERLLSEGNAAGRGETLTSRDLDDDDDDDDDGAAADDDDDDDDDANMSINSGSGGSVLLHSACRLLAKLWVTCDV